MSSAAPTVLAYADVAPELAANHKADIIRDRDGNIACLIHAGESHVLAEGEYLDGEDLAR